MPLHTSRTLYLLAFIFLILRYVGSEISAQQEKCSPTDERITYEGCNQDPRNKYLWCDLTNLRQLPPPEEIQSLTAPGEVPVIFMNNSCVVTLNPGTLSIYPKLEVLSFSDNLIERVASGTLSSLHKLRIFDLSYNHISQIEVNAFKGAVKLTRLNLSHNRLTRVEAADFASLESLEELLLNYNQLTSLDSQIFSSMPKLKVLGMSDNQLKHWAGIPARDLSCLIALNLAGNKISTLNDTTFNLPQLRTLSLKGNDLTFIHHGAFNKLANLTELELSNNKLKTIAPDAFKGLNELRTLSLAGNELTTIPSRWVEYFSRNIALSCPERNIFGDNAWTCDCTIKNYWTFLKSFDKNKQTKRKECFELECASPAALTGRELSSLSSEEICPNGKERVGRHLHHPRSNSTSSSSSFQTSSLTSTSIAEPAKVNVSSSRIPPPNDTDAEERTMGEDESGTHHDKFQEKQNLFIAQKIGITLGVVAMLIIFFSITMQVQYFIKNKAKAAATAPPNRSINHDINQEQRPNSGQAIVRFQERDEEIEASYPGQSLSDGSTYFNVNRTPMTTIYFNLNRTTRSETPKMPLLVKGGEICGYFNMD
ncbi:uncharacterized protein LOC143468726 [Clavelina lepadiformis]|uniref:uncharacterized protein LOC143468726 n=1 Tax=Clavelina lepadiformis TaxID=159417 RepID=UPI004041366C